MKYAMIVMYRGCNQDQGGNDSPDALTNSSLAAGCNPSPEIHLQLTMIRSMQLPSLLSSILADKRSPVMP
jgi:hypothetical protein